MTRKPFAVCSVDLPALPHDDGSSRGGRTGAGDTQRSESDRIDDTSGGEPFFLLIAPNRDTQRGAFFAIGVGVEKVALAELFLDSSDLFIGQNSIRQQYGGG